MKSRKLIPFVLMALLVASTLWAQAVGDYRTRNSGDWSNAQIWQRYNGTTWLATATPPNGSETILVQSSDSVYVNIPITITGTLVNRGIVNDGGNLTVGNGGTYQHDRDGGKIPTITWADGSRLLMTGTVSTAPENRNQNYYNIEFNTPSQLSNLNMNLNDATVRGNVRVVNTGSARWYLTTALANDTAIVTILGDVIVEAGAFAVQGTSNAQTTFIVHHYGNIVVTGGNFSISRGSQPGGTTTWYLYQGDFSMANATTQSSTQTPGGARFVFAKQGTQHLHLGEGNTLTALPIEIASGTTLDMGTSKLAGNGIFVVSEGATLMTALGGGVEEVLQSVTGAVTLAQNSSYGFNGSVHQVTSTRMPTIVADLIINNVAGVTLSQPTTINGTLRLVAGEFDNTIPFTLGPSGSISYEGGSLKVTVSVPREQSAVPASFFVEQNYPNPFNGSTLIRFGLPGPAEVSVKIMNLLGQEVATLLAGRKTAGMHQLVFEAGELPSGVYLCRVQAGNQVEVRRIVLLK
ncbi:MAG: T9SS type A sorting domain-containing protein [candidate division KSB1 bacterium]|nr:T9SS type A sorting domain-containing protein [candidate division KSB1 bacterium]